MNGAEQPPTGPIARVHRVAIAVAAAVAVLLLSPIPAALGPFPPGFTLGIPADKLVHFVLFLVAAWPWWRSFAVLGFGRPGFATVMCATTYAGLLELAQAGLTATRTAEWGDLLAGALGALAGVAAVGVTRLVRRPAVRTGVSPP